MTLTVTMYVFNMYKSVNMQLYTEVLYGIISKVYVCTFTEDRPGLILEMRTQNSISVTSTQVSHKTPVLNDISIIVML